ncbi:ABC transporter substrate-binding protein [Brucella intermedia]|uniref:ABC transporter substrate-binding protein n=1 Tax=Brucella intermedia TaxID=94625 RepID=UPI00224AC500|nr:ABC transporter substrate-binding protein [Brucella intermedia]
MKARFYIRLLLSAVAFVAVSPASAKEAITIAVKGALTSLDPQYQLKTTNQQLNAHFFDRLVGRDPQQKLIPALAESWTLIDDRTWEFKLRKGVKFHDGSEFTAEDVVYSINRIPTIINSPGSYSLYTSAIKNITVIDPHTIRFETHGIYPLLPSDMAGIFILPHNLGSNITNEDFSTGKAMIGTGPFRFLSYKPGDRVEMERNDDYWGEKPAFKHATYRIVEDDAARVAALLSGEVDVIDAVPTADIPGLRNRANLKLWQIDSLRLIYLMLDQHRSGPSPFVSGPNGEKLSVNPLKDKRVRQALSMAINRDGLVERVMDGAASPTGQFLPKGFLTYDPTLVPPAYDPAGAKALIAEAGFPDGFRITLNSPNNSYPNDAKIAQAIGQMWTRAGVRTSVETSPSSVFVSKANKQEYSAFLLGWTSTSGEASSPLRALLSTYNAEKGLGTANRSRYSNPELDAAISEALNTLDDHKREQQLINASRMALDDVGLIPLYHQKNTWATGADIRYVPRANEESHAYDASPAN